jgi:arsenite methyltransferase
LSAYIIKKEANTNFAELSQYDLNKTDLNLLSQSFGCGNPLMFSSVKNGDTVLDLGSGAGLDLILASEKVGCSGKVYGVDMTDEMLQRAQSNIDKKGIENIDLRKGYIEDLPIETDSIDWLFSNCVINLSPDKEKVFDEMHRVAKRGGKFVISDIVVEKVPLILKLFTPFLSACVSYAIPENEYIRKIEDAGFQNVTVLNREPYSRGQILQIINDDEIPGLKIPDYNFPVQLFSIINSTGVIQSRHFIGRLLI